MKLKTKAFLAMVMLLAEVLRLHAPASFCIQVRPSIIYFYSIVA
jgi:hypothetical protein